MERRRAAHQLEETNDFEIQEAYLTYTAPIGRGLLFKAGKFVTLVGAEVIESPLNYNVSRSFMFNYGILFTHTGLLATYPFTDMISLTGSERNRRGGSHRGMFDTYCADDQTD